MLKMLSCKANSILPFVEAEDEAFYDGIPDRSRIASRVWLNRVPSVGLKTIRLPVNLEGDLD